MNFINLWFNFIVLIGYGSIESNYYFALFIIIFQQKYILFSLKIKNIS